MKTSLKNEDIKRMVNIRKRKDLTVRVDRDTWLNTRIALPRLTDQERSRILFNTSAVKLERLLIDNDKKKKYKKR